jgi:hypothetical protein
MFIPLTAVVIMFSLTSCPGLFEKESPFMASIKVDHEAGALEVGDVVILEGAFSGRDTGQLQWFIDDIPVDTQNEKILFRPLKPGSFTIVLKVLSGSEETMTSTILDISEPSWDGTTYALLANFIGDWEFKYYTKYSTYPWIYRVNRINRIPYTEDFGGWELVCDPGPRYRITCNYSYTFGCHLLNVWHYDPAVDGSGDMFLFNIDGSKISGIHYWIGSDGNLSSGTAHSLSATKLKDSTYICEEAQ